MLGREWKALLVLKCNYSQRYGNYGQYSLCRALFLGILHAGSAAQQKVIQNMVTYAKKWGVKVEVCKYLNDRILNGAGVRSNS
jgi:hypothetical protein